MIQIQLFFLQLGEVVRHLGWGEIIDVAVVAFVLYQLLRLLRGTQGTQILVGLVLLAVVGVIASQFNLLLLTWLFKNAAFFILIGVRSPATTPTCTRRPYPRPFGRPSG